MFTTTKSLKIAEICIVGAGIHGVCSGYFLAKKGYKVIIIDKDYIAQRASGVNPGTTSVQNKFPDSLLLLAKKSIDVWDYFGNMDEKNVVLWVIDAHGIYDHPLPFHRGSTALKYS